MRLSIADVHYMYGNGWVVAEQEVGDKHGNYRLTKSGITDDSTGWWYFMRKYEGKENPYWYRKMRVKHSDDSIGEVVEEYVGTKLPFIVPRAWINVLRKKVSSGK
ncbi:MAG: hypothetical protein QXU32_02090 [Nitrososphaerales archaeon]